MVVKKYEKKSSGIYKVYIDDNEYLINEDVIIKSNLLYKKEISQEELNIILESTNYYNIYNKCVKYITYRIRSKQEIINYLKKLKITDKIIFDIIKQLEENNLINDKLFTKAFINDKLKFSQSGENKIRLELNKHNIDKNIIEEYLNNIDKEIIYKKINKIIQKNLKNKKANKIKIYKNLITNGYYNEDILYVMNNYDL